MPSETRSIIACTAEDIIGPCICEENGWEHEWGEAPESVGSPGLHWCENCDCCVAHMKEVDDANTK